LPRLSDKIASALDEVHPHVGYARSVAELEQWIDLIDLVESLSLGRRRAG
jgi:hypothetical protein